MLSWLPDDHPMATTTQPSQSPTTLSDVSSIPSISSSEDFRRYQSYADEAIHHCLYTRNEPKCLVKMFCGTGKSAVMAFADSLSHESLRRLQKKENVSDVLIAYVFPRLAILDQFARLYISPFVYKAHHLLCISSDEDHEDVKQTTTTNEEDICSWLNHVSKKRRTRRFICVTYQSYETLMNALDKTDKFIDLVVYDEAHHAVSPAYQSFIFCNHLRTNIGKQVFFTATPDNRNGIIMDPRKTCGKKQKKENNVRDVCNVTSEEMDACDDTSLNENDSNNDNEFTEMDCTDDDEEDMIEDSDTDVEEDSTKERIVIHDHYEGTSYFNTKGGHCGPLVFEYTYHDGERAGHLNPFDLHVEFRCMEEGETRDEPNVDRIYRSIVRMACITGNNRILAFHKTVSAGSKSETSVCNFVSQTKLERIYREVHHELVADNHPNLSSFVTYRIEGLDSSEDGYEEKRRRCLAEFNQPNDNELFILSSCDSIGEGADTKEANACVFVDPKTSVLKILQNIGRVVRKQKKRSVVYIPVAVDRNKYMEAAGDEEKADQVIRSDVEKGGDFRMIMNVTSALKQELKEMYDFCLNYPNGTMANKQSRSDFDNELRKQGYRVHRDHEECDGSLASALNVCWDDYLEHNNDKRRNDEGGDDNNVGMMDVDGDDGDENNCPSPDYLSPSPTPSTDTSSISSFVTAPESLEELEEWAKERDVGVEVHTRDMESPVQQFNVSSFMDEDGNILRVMEDKDKFLPITRDANSVVKTSVSLVRNPSKNVGPRIVWSHDDDMKVLWKDMGLDMDNLCRVTSNAIESRIVQRDMIWAAKQIVKRAIKRQQDGGTLYPKSYSKPSNPERIQEKKDFYKLDRWRNAVDGKGECSPPCKEVQDILDDCFGNQWRTTRNLKQQSIENANDIVKRAIERQQKGKTLYPNSYRKPNNPEQIQENKDCQKMNSWRMGIDGKGTCLPPCQKVQNILGDCFGDRWKTTIDLKQRSIDDANDIVKRAIERQQKGKTLYPKSYSKPSNSEQIQENKDYQKINSWKTGGKGGCLPPCQKVQNILGDCFGNRWRTTIDLKQRSIDDANDIVKRAIERQQKGKTLYPKSYREPNNSEQIQENKDYKKLKAWRIAVDGKGKGLTPCQKVQDILDKYFGDRWRTTKKEKSKSKSAQLSTVSDTILEDNDLSSDEPERKRQKKEKCQVGIVQKYHNKHCKMKSANRQKSIQKHPKEWKEYHQARTESESLYASPETDIPRNIIFNQIVSSFEFCIPSSSPSSGNKRKKCDEDEEEEDTKTILNVADLGCGLGELTARLVQAAAASTNDIHLNIHPMDHLASDQFVNEVNGCSRQIIEGDYLTTTIAPPRSMDIVILCQSMWGPEEDKRKAIRVARRLLRNGGSLYVGESTTRWSDIDEPTGKVIAGTEAIHLKSLLESEGFLLDTRAESQLPINKYCVFRCIK